MATKAARKRAVIGHRHVTCMEDVRIIGKIGFGIPGYVGKNREGDGRSNVKRRDRWKRFVVTGDLQEEGVLDLDIYAFGRYRRRCGRMWPKKIKKKSDQGRTGEFFIKFAKTTIRYETNRVGRSSTETYRQKFTYKAETVFVTRSEFNALLDSHVTLFLAFPGDLGHHSLLDIASLSRLHL